MWSNESLLSSVSEIYRIARDSDDGSRCMVAPAPELNDRIRQEVREMAERENTALGALRLRASEPRRDGFNDGLIIPPSLFPLGTPPSVIRSAALERAPLRGAVRVIVVLVDFSDRPMAATNQHFNDLFFSTGVIPTKSVREYYREVTNGGIDLQGEVVGPFRLPQTIATYANGGSGIGGALPNARTMARDALLAADPTVSFSPYDNDGDGFVDAFIVIHAGTGGEVTGNVSDIWSHKWVLDGGETTVDGTKVFAYLTVPEDCRIGVCAHELGHLLFGFPDLYDADGSSEGVGNFCLMGGGSWGGGGNTPVHPSAWCKANQGWAAVDNVVQNGPRSFPDVKDAHLVTRLWKDGGSGPEYFLVENRQQAGFDVSLPGGGLLIWHIDESVANNTNESHYKVALIQADGQRDMEGNRNRGDAGDPYPGTAGNTAFSEATNPNSKSYSGQSTCVSVTGIGGPGPVMNASVTVRCISKLIAKEVLKDKEFRKEGRKEDLKEFIDEKRLPDKFAEKPVTDKGVALDKNTDKFSEGKFNEGKLVEKPGEGGFDFRRAGDSGIEARVAQLEAIIGALLGQSGVQARAFIGPELRPDLSAGATANEPDAGRGGAPDGGREKRQFDTKPTER